MGMIFEGGEKEGEKRKRKRKRKRAFKGKGMRRKQRGIIIKRK